MLIYICVIIFSFDNGSDNGNNSHEVLYVHKACLRSTFLMSNWKENKFSTYQHTLHEWSDTYSSSELA